MRSKCAKGAVEGKKMVCKLQGTNKTVKLLYPALSNGELLTCQIFPVRLKGKTTGQLGQS